MLSGNTSTAEFAVRRCQVRSGQTALLVPKRVPAPPAPGSKLDEALPWEARQPLGVPERVGLREGVHPGMGVGERVGSASLF